eukprot:5378061-Alexandrium_andersonii.AAC.1
MGWGEGGEEPAPPGEGAPCPRVRAPRATGRRWGGGAPGPGIPRRAGGGPGPEQGTPPSREGLSPRAASWPA